SGDLIVDACRRALRRGPDVVPLARRPVLFALARALGEAWPSPAGVERDALIARAFEARRPNASHRARLRVEIGRLRAPGRPLLRAAAPPVGSAPPPCTAAGVAVLAPPIDGEPASLLALLADGAAWSTSALALALGASQRTVQRALAELEAAGRVRAVGRARARRRPAAPPAPVATTVVPPTPLAARLYQI